MMAAGISTIALSFSCVLSEQVRLDVVLNSIEQIVDILLRPCHVPFCATTKGTKCKLALYSTLCLLALGYVECFVLEKGCPCSCRFESVFLDRQLLQPCKTAYHQKAGMASASERYKRILLDFFSTVASLSRFEYQQSTKCEHENDDQLLHTEASWKLLRCRNKSFYKSFLLLMIV